ncbi:MAG: hypothetical protein JF571_10415, partial [Asticcacaulis sp.]|nr:hypothetical protein [Asticcacaulis sp.]
MLENRPVLALKIVHPDAGNLDSPAGSMHTLSAAALLPTPGFRAPRSLYAVRTEATPLPADARPAAPIRTEQDLVVQLARMPID